VTNKKLAEEVTRLKRRVDALESLVVDILRREALKKTVLERVGKSKRKLPKRLGKRQKR
jgi:hypothetical protein